MFFTSTPSHNKDSIAYGQVLPNIFLEETELCLSNTQQESVNLFAFLTDIIKGEYQASNKNTDPLGDIRSAKDDFLYAGNKSRGQTMKL